MNKIKDFIYDKSDIRRFEKNFKAKRDDRDDNFFEGLDKDEIAEMKDLLKD